MTKQSSLSLTGLVLIATAIVSSNIEATAQNVQKPQPSPELEQIEYFRGNWRCYGQEVNSAQPLPPTELTWNVERSLDNFWYVGQAQEQKTFSNPKQTSSQEFIGYNGASEQFVRLQVASNGNLLNLSSPGWKGKQWVWEGTVVDAGKELPIREVITQRSRSEFTAVYYLKDRSGENTPVIEEICRLENADERT